MTLWPAEYIYSVSKAGLGIQPRNNGEVLLTSFLNVNANRNYTIYLFNWMQNSPDSIKALIVEELV